MCEDIIGIKSVKSMAINTTNIREVKL